MIVAERLSLLLAELLREDPRRVLVGEDVRDGGMVGLSRAALVEPALAARLVATPLIPSAQVAHAAGLAMAGRRPILIVASATALLDGYVALRELARLRGCAGGERSGAVVILAPVGPGFGLGGDGAESPEAVIAALVGLRVLCVGDADEAAAYVRGAASFDAGEGPTVVLLPRSLLLAECAEDRALGRPLGAARVVREGAEATVFAWGGALAPALAAIEASGREVALVDVGGLAPIDEAAVIAAAGRSGKVVIAHPGGAGPLAAEIAAMVADQAILHLDAPVLRVSGREGPLTYPDEAAALPSVESIAAAIARVILY
jgi:pyruvate/2-oxoglutarate/acetoin dehydrogenase E1 component